jgi:hypothetical protein
MIILTHSQGKDVVVNSWVGYPWTKVNFGLEQDASFMRVPPSFRSPRQINVAPVSDTLFCLRASLRPWEMRKFKQYLLESEVGFVVREHRNCAAYFPLWDTHYWTCTLETGVNHVLGGLERSWSVLSGEKSH